MRHLVAVVAGQHALGHHDLLLQPVRHTLKINSNYYFPVYIFSCETHLGILGSTLPLTQCLSSALDGAQFGCRVTDEVAPGGTGAGGVVCNTCVGQGVGEGVHGGVVRHVGDVSRINAIVRDGGRLVVTTVRLLVVNLDRSLRWRLS